MSGERGSKARAHPPVPLDPRSVPDDLRQVMLRDKGQNFGFRMQVWANFFSGPLFAEIEKRFGILRDEFTVLGHLYDYGPMLATAITVLTGRPKNSISRSVNGLIAAGHISRRTNPKDRREAFLTIEPSGRALYEQLWPFCAARDRQMFQALDADDLAQLDQLLWKLLRSYHLNPDLYALEPPPDRPDESAPR